MILQCLITCLPTNTIVTGDHGDRFLTPIQLRPHCGRNWIYPIELSCSFQLPDTKSTTVFRFRFFCKILDKIRAIVGSFLALLFFFKDAATSVYQGCVSVSAFIFFSVYNKGWLLLFDRFQYNYHAKGDSSITIGVYCLFFLLVILKYFRK